MDASSGIRRRIPIVFRFLWPDISAYIARGYKKPATILFTSLFVLVAGAFYKIQSDLKTSIEQTNQSFAKLDDLAFDMPRMDYFSLTARELREQSSSFHAFTKIYSAMTQTGHQVERPLVMEALKEARKSRSMLLELSEETKPEKFRSDYLVKLFKGWGDEFGALTTSIAYWEEILQSDLSGDLARKAETSAAFQADYESLIEGFDRLERRNEEFLDNAKSLRKIFNREQLAWEVALEYQDILAWWSKIARLYMIAYIVFLVLTVIRFIYKRNIRRFRTVFSKSLPLEARRE